MGGRRVTTPEAMVYVERILSGEINKGLAAELHRLRVTPWACPAGTGG